MNAPTNIQVIHGPEGQPAFVVIPYAEYMASRTAGQDLIPNDVVGRTVHGATLIRAWREHLGLTQAEVAERLGIAQPTYAQQENSARPRRSSVEKIARAMGLTNAQLGL